MLRRSLAAVMSAGLLLTAGCAGDDLAEDSSGETSDTGGGGEVRISGQSFPEAALVTAMYDELLTEAGYTTTINLVDTRDVYMGEFPGSVDVVPEYVGGVVDFLSTTIGDGETLTTTDAQESIDNAQALLEEKGITLLAPSEATDTNAFFVTQEYSEENGVTALSDLEGETVTLAAAPDCEGRPDCAGGLTDVYGIDIAEVLPLGFASDQTYQSVLDGESQLGLTSTTDGTLESQGLVLLEDDQSIQPAQNLVPAISTEFLDANPDIADVLEPLMSALTTENLTELNGRVAVDRETPEDVARDFLEEEGLLG
ncbi:ABC transporter substrate-binding protein [Nocardioides euryhalodurans]|uniref:ABC transporter substrate-binding protein n=1 Tax=Nocardioides euryhalodurans TaxID=2518370 RepID=A0A4P7GKK2_9ACTN|nr:ABC transporter substrate-binding protein [Nocardioides euryhalodurans]QBR92566.1 ABC transporter substrate-binding protein [Nocardioides euryhalodurans]